jgi:membrane-bound ClpP family serine protease
MTWIIILMLIGLLLLFYEVYFIPGTSLLGVIGGISCIFAIVIIFRKFGHIPGYISLFLLVLAVFILILTGARNKVWQRISNRNILSGKSNIVEQDDIKQGLTGYAITNIHPIGTGRFNENNYIVQTDGVSIQKGTQIEVVKVNVTKIIVKPIVINADLH